jgi:HD superfamily phosphohydrolase
MREQAEQLAQELKGAISEWIRAPLSSIKGLTSGGSGTIITVDSEAKTQACLKLVRCDRCGSLKEHIKLIREFSNLVRGAGQGKTRSHVIPVLNRDLALYDPTDYATVTTRFSELLEDLSKLDENDFDGLKQRLSSCNDYIVTIGHGNHVHTGILTARGYPLGDMLRYYAEFISGKPEMTPPQWVVAFTAPNDISSGAPVFRSTYLLERLTLDLLEALVDIHGAGLVHLDIKEENVLALPPDEKGDCPLFVLFDFGSAQEMDPHKRTEDRFEATYQYLPTMLQQLFPLSQFTSHLRAPIRFSQLLPLEIEPAEIDLHALSCMIHNFLVDNRFRRISSFLDDEEYETAFAFSQLIDIDQRDADLDAIGNEHRTGFAQVALARYRRAQELQQGAISDWEAKENILASSDAHPASEVYRRSSDLLGTRAAERFADDERDKKTTEILDELQKEWLPKARQTLDASLLGKPVQLSPLLDSPLVQRLGSIRQLALTYLKHPDSTPWYAQHSRLEHVVGMVEVVKLYLIALLKQSGWFRLRYLDRDGVYLLLAAFLHDLGHYPCAHYLEETKIFPSHDQVGRSTVEGDLTALKLDTQSEKETLGGLGWKPLGDRTLDTFTHDQGRCETNHGIGAACFLRWCNPNDVHELHEKLKLVLSASGGTQLDDFVQWFQNAMTRHTSYGTQHERLIFRVFRGLLSGPIDADKLHYLVFDALHCNLSLAAPFQGADFGRLLNSLRVAVRQPHGSGTQRFCLGLKEEAVHLAQLVIFLRAAMFGEVYWSSRSRASTVMLLFLLLESIAIIGEFGSTDDVAKYVGRWIRGSDDDARTIAREMANAADSLLRERKKDQGRRKLVEIWKDLYETQETRYSEVCKVYPSDTVAYAAIRSFVGEISIGDHAPVSVGKQRPVGVQARLLDIIRSAVSEALRIEHGRLEHGDVLVDVPIQETSKSREFPTLALVDRQGFGRPVGSVWRVIEQDFEDSIRVVRVFLRDGIVPLDHEDRAAVRAALLSKLS